MIENERAVTRLPRLRAAIVHDWFAGLYGGERVVEAMRSGLFDLATPPDILTFYAVHELLPAELNAAIVRESRLARLPGVRQRGHGRGRWRYLLPLMPAYFRRLDLDDYDVVIASSHACAINARPRPDALYVCYCHTPMRYAWMPELERERFRGATGTGLRLIGGHLRRVDRAAARRPHGMVANSTAVRDRIRRFYGRDAEVIPPPVDVERFDPHAEKEPGHFLWVHRLVDYKQPELVAEAFRGLPYRLTMVGTGPLEGRLRSTLPANVTLQGWTSQPELEDLFARASGFIHVGEEDFGIAFVEALAAGTPVIALDRGGARDIVRPQADGLLLDELSVESLRDSIRAVASRTWEPAELAARAREFSRQRFLSRMSAYVADLLSERGGG